MTDSKKPTHRAFIVKKFNDKEGTEKSRWLDIGSVWTHRDGKGFDLNLEAVPLDGRHRHSARRTEVLDANRVTPTARVGSSGAGFISSPERIFIMTNQAKPTLATSHADLLHVLNELVERDRAEAAACDSPTTKCRGLRRGDAPSLTPAPLHRPSLPTKSPSHGTSTTCEKFGPILPPNSAAKFCNRQSAVTMQAWASIGMSSQFTPTTSFRRKATPRRLKSPTARVGLSGAGFFFRLSFSKSARPTRSDRRGKRNTGGIVGASCTRARLSSCQRPFHPKRRENACRQKVAATAFSCVPGPCEGTLTRAAPVRPTPLRCKSIGQQHEPRRSYGLRHVCVCNGGKTRERGRF